MPLKSGFSDGLGGGPPFLFTQKGLSLCVLFVRPAYSMAIGP